MIAIDTNIVVRFLTHDDAVQYKKAYKLFNEHDVFIADTVILETEWVLRFAYNFYCKRWAKKPAHPTRLRVNPNKSGVGHSWNGKFLGFRINSDGRIAPAQASLDRLKDQVRSQWNAQESIPLEDRIKRWQQYIRGWWNYFSICQQRRGIKMLEGWIRRHMRKYFWQRWHNRRGRLNALKRRKAKPYHLSQASGSVGTWRLARSPMLQTVLNNARFRHWGLLVPSDFATI